MSRIGNSPIQIPQAVTITQNGVHIMVKGSQGELTLTLPHGITIEQRDTTVFVKRTNESKSIRSLHGYFRAVLHNAVIGVSEGWKRTLELSGVGYRANLSGANLVLSLGFSHPVTIEPPQGITFSVQEGSIVISGINNQEVGAIAAKIRSVKKPEPYKGKGIRYKGEHIRKKAGKAKAVGGAPGAGGK